MSLNAANDDDINDVILLHASNCIKMQFQVQFRGPMAPDPEILHERGNHGN